MADKAQRLALYSSWIDTLRQREEGPNASADGATSTALAELCQDTEDALYDGAGSLLPAEIDRLMKKMEKVMDAWLFPEEDAVGKAVREVFGGFHDALGHQLDDAIPEIGAKRKTYENLRAAAWLAQRSAVAEERKKPGSGSRFSWKIYLGTLGATALYQSGKFLSRVAKKLGDKQERA